MGWPGLTREVQDICKKVGLPDVTKKYLCREEIIKHIQYYDMKMAKENMADKEKCQVIRNRDCRYVQPYMYKKSLLQSRMEFLWDTMMIDTRTTMKGKYAKDKYSCPHCREGREQGELETPSHLLTSCSAYSDLRTGVNPELVLEDRATFLIRAIARRKELEQKLRTEPSRAEPARE
jgi:hypothetical protein